MVFVRCLLSSSPLPKKKKKQQLRDVLGTIEDKNPTAGFNPYRLGSVHVCVCVCVCFERASLLLLVVGLSWLDYG